MQTILLEDRLFEIPSNYNEATPEQIRTIIRYDTQKMSQPTRFFLITLCLMNIQKRFWLRFRWFYKLKTAETLLEMGDFTAEIETFLNNPIPFYQQKFPILGRFRKLFGPGDALENITFRQFRQAEELSYNYSQTRQERHLDELLSILYLRKPYAKFWKMGVIDRLTALDDDRNLRLEILDSIPMDTKQAIFLWYLGSRSVLMRQFPRIFQSSGRTEPVQEKNAITSQKIGESYAKLLDGLAETAPNYGPWDATSIYDVLNNYQEKLIESDRIRERNKN